MEYENLCTRIKPNTTKALDHFLADRPKLKKYEVVELALRSFLRENGAYIPEDQSERDIRRKSLESGYGIL